MVGPVAVGPYCDMSLPLGATVVVVVETLEGLCLVFEQVVDRSWPFMSRLGE